MIDPKSDDRDEYDEEEAARRRDELARRILRTPPEPRKPLGKPKPKRPVKPKDRGAKK